MDFLVTNARDLGLEDPIYFVRGNHAFVCEGSSFERIMRGDSLPELDRFVSYFREDETWGNLSPTEQRPSLVANEKTHWIQFFPSLEIVYREALQSQLRDHYFDMIFSGVDNDFLRTLFREALTSTVSSVKIVDTTSEPYQTLSRCIAPLIEALPLEGDAVLERHRLSEVHKLAVLAQFGLSSSEAPQDTEANQKRGFLFLVLGALMTKYTSSAIFGEENTSPEPLRNYADALLKTACDYGSISPEEYTDYSNRLLGIDRVFTCTSVLFNRLNSKMQAVLAQNPDDQTYLDIKAMIPPTWQ